MSIRRYESKAALARALPAVMDERYSHRNSRCMVDRQLLLLLLSISQARQGCLTRKLYKPRRRRRPSGRGTSGRRPSTVPSQSRRLT
eukprot:5768979-Prorocentrum_lima.AAC.1